MKHTKEYFVILSFLIILFIVYNQKIYTNKSNYGSVLLSKNGVAGEDIWLKNNCNSCHQLYGLGGYLGPDLTNVYTKRGDLFIKAMINSQIKAMPKFDLSDKEQNDLVQFLKEVEQTGYYPNHDATPDFNGWISLKYKNFESEK